MEIIVLVKNVDIYTTQSRMNICKQLLKQTSTKLRATFVVINCRMDWK